MNSFKTLQIVAENEKIELKKILLENFENLDQEEIKILKEI